MQRVASHPAYDELMHQHAIDAAREAIHEYRRTQMQEQIRKSRVAYREQSSKDGGSGTITLIPRTVNTVRFHTLLAVVGAASGNITIVIGDDSMVFPQNPPGGYIFFDGLDFLLGRGDKRSLTIATPGNPLFFGLYGEEVGDALAVG